MHTDLACLSCSAHACYISDAAYPTSAVTCRCSDSACCGGHSKQERRADLLAQLVAEAAGAAAGGGHVGAVGLALPGGSPLPAALLGVLAQRPRRPHLRVRRLQFLRVRLYLPQHTVQVPSETCHHMSWCTKGTRRHKSQCPCKCSWWEAVCILCRPGRACWLLMRHGA